MGFYCRPVTQLQHIVYLQKKREIHPSSYTHQFNRLYMYLNCNNIWWFATLDDLDMKRHNDEEI